MNIESISRFARPAAVAFSLLALAACDDPAKNKDKAVTTTASSSSVSPTMAETKPTGAAATYEIEPTKSKVEFTGSKVTAKHEGSFKSFKGTVSFVEGAPEKSSVNVDIDMDSLTIEPEKLFQHLKSPDLLDVAKFPKTTFASTEVKKGGTGTATHTITGNLTLHGVTKSISFPATVKPAPSTVDVDAEFTINRKDFGINYPGMANDLIRDDVVIKLTVRAPKKG